MLALGLLLGQVLAPVAASGTPVAPLTTGEGYRVPQPDTALPWPNSLGSHPDFKIEWWYITGHLWGEDGRHFGFQATFFRQALQPPGSAPTGVPDYGADQLYLAHMALSDLQGERFLYEERLNRGGWDAGAAVGHLDVHNGNWRLRSGQRGGALALTLEGSIRAEARLDLAMRPLKPLVRFGEGGVSRKGADPAALSYYLTFPRLEVSGTLALGGVELGVSGRAWLDHEIASNQLSDDLTGWDWVSAHLDDGSELMAFQLRRRDGTPEPANRLYWIAPDGQLHSYGPEHFEWSVREHRASAVTGTSYPWAIEVAFQRPDRATPSRYRWTSLMEDQEISGALGGIAYFEGASAVRDAAGQRVGYGYMELTGYAAPLGEGLR